MQQYLVLSYLLCDKEVNALRNCPSVSRPLWVQLQRVDLEIEREVGRSSRAFQSCRFEQTKDFDAKWNTWNAKMTDFYLRQKPLPKHWVRDNSDFVS